jgi:nucleotide-binding universal stress UspA family protein
MATILIPLDGSDLAAAALKPAAELARKLPAELLLLRVVDSANYASLYTDPALWKDPETELEPDRRALDEVAAGLRADGLTVSTEIVIGSPASSIAATAEERGVDMIAMATHGRGGIARLALGSVAEAVLHRVHIPMLLIRPEPMRRPSAEPRATGDVGTWAGIGL